VNNYKQNEVVLLRMPVLGPVTKSQAVSVLGSHQNQRIVIEETKPSFALFQCFSSM